jgi:hypothetical protein
VERHHRAGAQIFALAPEAHGRRST